MEQHIKILAILFMVLGILGIVAAVIILVVGGVAAAGIGSQVGNDPDAAGGALAAGGCMTAIAVFVGILSLPSLATGWGLLKHKSWSRVLGIIVSILSLPSVPIGTAIGVYGLWVLFNDETKRILVQ
jgi:hypothetical protein